MAHVSEVRPISVTENIKWNLMSSISKIFWAIGTLLNMLSLTVLSLRIDRLADLNYVLNHWKHYSGEKKEFHFHFEEKILDLHRALNPKETTEADLQDMNGGFAFSS